MQYRESKRFAIDQLVNVRCASWGQFVQLYTKDLCRGGMFIRTESPPPPGTKLTINLLLPGDHDIRIAAAVVRVVSPDTAAAEGQVAGMGVKFETLTDDEERTLKELWELAATAGEAPSQVKAKPAAPSRAPTSADAVLGHLRQIRSMLATKNEWEVLGLSAGASMEQVQAAFEELSREYSPARFVRFDDAQIDLAAAAITGLFKGAHKKLQEAVKDRPAEEPALAVDAGVAVGAPGGAPTTRPSSLQLQALFDGIEVGDEQPGATALTALKQHTVLPGSRTLSADWKIVNVSEPEQEETNPTSASSYVSRAAQLVEQERLEAAVRDLKQALSIEPGNRKAQAYLLLIEARRLKRKGQFVEAVAKYQAALVLDETIEEAVKEVRSARRGLR